VDKDLSSSLICPNQLRANGVVVKDKSIFDGNLEALLRLFTKWHSYTLIPDMILYKNSTSPHHSVQSEASEFVGDVGEDR
jgi:hypothetical protein